MTGDVSFKITEGGRKYRFNYRVAAIIEANEKILIHKFLDADYSFLLGGRVKVGETAQAAIMRELAEEIDLHSPTIVGLPFIAENFFEYADENFHEISLFFSIDGKNLKLPIHGEIRGKVQFLWHAGNELENINLQPEFLCEELNRLPLTTKHIVNFGKNFRK